ncbi:hypothetical protein [Komagataeibacter xylinus]|uniref:hypothetical protein n=1 Tax=Komagataeibacter xylinus TaxID=28448 RepID=UPI00280AAE91|nr:hypothetical protein [Komagataeibacter xylinus]
MSAERVFARLWFDGATGKIYSAASYMYQAMMTDLKKRHTEYFQKRICMNDPVMKLVDFS